MYNTRVTEISKIENTATRVAQDYYFWNPPITSDRFVKQPDLQKMMQALNNLESGIWEKEAMLILKANVDLHLRRYSDLPWQDTLPAITMCADPSQPTKAWDDLLVQLMKNGKTNGVLKEILLLTFPSDREESGEDTPLCRWFLEEHGLDLKQEQNDDEIEKLWKKLVFGEITTRLKHPFLQLLVYALAVVINYKEHPFYILCTKKTWDSQPYPTTNLQPALV